MADESKLAKEIIDLDTEEEKIIDFDFSGDLDTGRALTGTPLITTDSGLTLSSKVVSGSIAQVLLNAGATVGRYIIKCVVEDDGGTVQTYVGRGTVIVA